MPWRLVGLHNPGEAAVALPREGEASVGRRPTNAVVIPNLAVSGQHCVLRCRPGGVSEPPELEDCSTNGTYVNEVRLSKGQRKLLADGDLVALTKPPEEELQEPVQGPRVQFRLEFREGEADGTALEFSLQERASLGDRLELRTTLPPPMSLPPPSFVPSQLQAAPIAATPLDRPQVAGFAAATPHLGGMLATPSPAEGRLEMAATGRPSDQSSASAAIAASAGVGATSPHRGAEHSFAQDLLVQEQQSKAKITGELLIAQRKLEEERLSAESMGRELRKIRQQVEEERSRRHEAEEGRDRLTNEAELLRQERRQLKELTVAHDELRNRHDNTKAKLSSHQQRCQQLEASQEQMQHELERLNEANAKTSQQHAEVSTRVRQAQERAERLEQQHAEAQRDAERLLEEGARLQRQLAAEVGARGQLEQEVNECKELVVKAEASERTAREALDAATARRAELECQASSAHSDAEAARAAARQAQQRLAGTLRHAEVLREAGQNLSTELRRRAALWERALTEGVFDGLVDALAGQEVSTFEAVTCRNDVGESPARGSQNPEEPPAVVQVTPPAIVVRAPETAASSAPPSPVPATPVGQVRRDPSPAARTGLLQEPTPSPAVTAGRLDVSPLARSDDVAPMAMTRQSNLSAPISAAASGAGLGSVGAASAAGGQPWSGATATASARSRSRSPQAPEPERALQPPGSPGQQSSATPATARTVTPLAAVAAAGGFHNVDDDDDDLLAAVSREPAGVPKALGEAGCSTAWSLELMDVVDSRLGVGTDEQAQKRPRLGV